MHLLEAGISLKAIQKYNLLSKVDVFGNLLNRSLHGRGTHRCGGRRPALFTGKLVVSAIYGKQLSPVSVRDPILPQQFERRGGKRCSLSDFYEMPVDVTEDGLRRAVVEVAFGHNVSLEPHSVEVDLAEWFASWGECKTWNRLNEGEEDGE